MPSFLSDWLQRSTSAVVYGAGGGAVLGFFLGLYRFGRVEPEAIGIGALYLGIAALGISVLLAILTNFGRR